MTASGWQVIGEAFIAALVQHGVTEHHDTPSQAIMTLVATTKARALAAVQDEVMGAHAALTAAGIQEDGGDEDGGEFALTLEERIKLLADRTPSAVKESLTTEATVKDSLSVQPPPCDHWYYHTPKTPRMGRSHLFDGEPSVGDIASVEHVGGVIVKLYLAPERVSVAYTLPEPDAYQMRDDTGEWRQCRRVVFEQCSRRHDVRALYAAPPAAPAPPVTVADAATSAWQPMDSAPTDGTEILTLWPKLQLDDNGEQTETVIGHVRAVSSWLGHWTEPDSFEASGSRFDDDWEVANAPTHWAHLPPNPDHRAMGATKPEN